VLETLIGHAVTQRIIDKPFKVEELFAPGTHNLVA
jgi:hypothetical protein